MIILVTLCVSFKLSWGEDTFYLCDVSILMICRWHIFMLKSNIKVQFCCNLSSCTWTWRQLRDAERYLGDDDVAVWRSASFDEAVHDELGHLGGFATARRSSDDHHGVVVQGVHDLLLKLFDRQLVALHQDLKHIIYIYIYIFIYISYLWLWTSEWNGRKQTDLLQVFIMIQLVHQLVVQVAADLLRGALRGGQNTYLKLNILNISGKHLTSGNTTV